MGEKLMLGTKNRFATFVFTLFFLLTFTPTESIASFTPASGDEYVYTDIQVGWGYSCGLTSTNLVACWGNFESYEPEMPSWLAPGFDLAITLSEPTLVPDVEKVVQIASGDNDLCFLIIDGSIDCRGKSSFIYSPFEIHNATEISVGAAGGCAIVITKKLKCWSSYLKKITEIDNISNPIQLAEDSDNSKGCVLQSDGTIKCWGTVVDETESEDAKHDPAAESVSANKKFGLSSLDCGIEITGHIYCWGYGTNNYDLSSLSDFEQLSYSRSGVLCAKNSEMKVICWGNNSYGQLGNSESLESNTPILNEQADDIKKISVSVFHNCALLNSGAIRCWGDNRYQQVGNNSGNAYTISSSKSAGNKYIAKKKPSPVKTLLYFRGGQSWSSEKSVHWSGAFSYKTPITGFQFRWVSEKNRWTKWKSVGLNPYYVFDKKHRVYKVQVRVANKHGTSTSKVFNLKHWKWIQLISFK